jgi:hypothetical protein
MHPQVLVDSQKRPEDVARQLGATDDDAGRTQSQLETIWHLSRIDFSYIICQGDCATNLSVVNVNEYQSPNT